MAKNSPANTGNARDEGSIPGLGRFPGGEHDNPFQYSCLEERTWAEESAGLYSLWTEESGGLYSPWGLKESRYN